MGKVGRKFDNNNKSKCGGKFWLVIFFWSFLFMSFYYAKTTHFNTFAIPTTLPVYFAFYGVM